jgi:hypothetical protein
VKPRIPLPADAVTDSGLADTSGMAPAVSAARRQLRRTAFRMRSVDAVTTELVRIRNARFQNCNY